MKRIFSAILVLAMLVMVFAGCTPTASTPTPASGTTSGGDTPAVNGDPIPIRLASTATFEKDLNILRDLLIKGGFDASVNIVPDSASLTTLREAGNYDVILTGWTTITANPDYAVRSLFYTGADYNYLKVSDPELDRLIDQAATETPDVYVNTYAEFEKHLIEENAYILPLYANKKLVAFDHAVLDADSVRLPISRSFPWEDFSYVDASQNETRPLVFTQTSSTPTSFYTIKANDGSVSTMNANMYVRLVNLADDDSITSVGSLTHNHATAEGNAEYYFILRDDINFAKVENGVAVDTGVRVGADDVIFTFENATNKDSVPDHRTYSLYSYISGISAVTDMAELDKALSGKSGTLKDDLSVGLPSEITALTDDKTQADSDAGVYQVIKITTKEPFPQVLNFLAHTSAGITSKEQVTKIMEGIDVANYDPTTDKLYGEPTSLNVGDDFDNHLWASGPYIALHKDQYEIVFERNPAYMPESDNFGIIKNIKIRFINTVDAAVSAFRAGEIDIVSSIPETMLEVVQNDPQYTVKIEKSNGVYYAYFNITTSKFADKDLRLAALYCVDQDAYINFYKGMKIPAYSTASTIVDTGHTLTPDLNKVTEHLNAYRAKVG